MVDVGPEERLEQAARTSRPRSCVFEVRSPDELGGGAIDRVDELPRRRRLQAELVRHERAGTLDTVVSPHVVSSALASGMTRFRVVEYGTHGRRGGVEVRIRPMRPVWIRGDVGWNGNERV